MADQIYADANKNIKVSKTKVREGKKNTRTKTVTYSPISYYGKQTRTVTRTKKKN